MWRWMMPAMSTQYLTYTGELRVIDAQLSRERLPFPICSVSAVIGFKFSQHMRTACCNTLCRPPTFEKLVIFKFPCSHRSLTRKPCVLLSLRRSTLPRIKTQWQHSCRLQTRITINRPTIGFKLLIEAPSSVTRLPGPEDLPNPSQSREYSPPEH